MHRMRLLDDLLVLCLCKAALEAPSASAALFRAGSPACQLHAHDPAAVMCNKQALARAHMYCYHNLQSTTAARLYN